MARIIDPDDPPDDESFDLSELFCPNPRCGANDVRIITYPRPGSWWGIGKAHCNVCGRTFTINAGGEPAGD